MINRMKIETVARSYGANQKELLLCGGAYGHLMHLYDNRELTFVELKSVLSSASRGKLEKATEKTDGMNLVFSWSVLENRLKVARSAGDIKGGGMDAAKLAARFQDRGNITEAFNNAFSVLAQAIGVISDNVKVKVFGKDAEFWYSIEVIYSLNPNVINYDKNYLVFHAHGFFYLDADGNVAQETDATGIDLLEAYIDKMQEAVEKTSWRVSAPQIARLKGLSDKTVLSNSLAKISTAQANAGVSDNKTIDDYLHSLFTREATKLGFEPEVTKAIVSRCLGDEGAPGLNEIKKLVGKEGFPRTSEFVKSSQTMLSSFIEPIEVAVHELSVELLKGLKSVMVASHDVEVNRLRSEVSAAINAIEKSGNQQAIDILNKQLKKLGGLDKIASSSEGIVFRFKGNVYKFTGSFAPVNQILGLFKYGRKGVKIPTPTSEGLKTLIKQIINEATPLPPQPTPSGRGAEMDAYERQAKQKYEDAVATLAAWDDNEAKKVELFNRARQLGISPDVARKRFAGDPTVTYSPKIAQKKRSTLEADLLKAEDEYAEYEPSIKGYAGVRKTGGAKSTANKEMPPSDKKELLSIDSIKPVTWYTWPKNIVKSGKSYGSAKTKTGDEESGVGPGEEWLAYTFGAQMQGGSVSFDLVTKDGRTWEVKALDKPSDTIRPGTEGLRAFEKPRRRLNSIMTQLKNFITIARKPGFLGPTDVTPEQKKVIDYVTVFVEDNYDMIVGKGEIGNAKFIMLRGVLKAINQFKAMAPTDATSTSPTDTRIGLNDKEVRVDKQTFIDVAKKVEKATGEKDVLSDLGKYDILVSTLKDDAFNRAGVFFDEWFDSVDLNKVFEQVNGVFVVNPRGFMMIPSTMFKRALMFDRVSQGKPKFSLKLPFGP
jgi:hypothetical protein